jgi:hypothetical protein
MTKHMNIYFWVILLIIFNHFVSFPAYAELSTKGASISPPGAFLICAQDSDCIEIGNDCSSCCNPGTAINKSSLKEFVNQVRLNCENYKGGVCNCVENENIKWEPKCVKGKCDMVSHKVSIDDAKLQIK